MVKLDGVKVLDMNNGEVLRLEYNGDIYEKTNELTKKSDIEDEQCCTRFKLYGKSEDERDQNELMFSSIGRKPNEFKIGDIVRFKGANDYIHALKGYEGIIVEVIDIDKNSLLSIRLAVPSFINMIADSWSKECDIELVTPVEARVDKPF